MGEEVDTIGKSAFYRCTELLALNIPQSVKVIDNYAFGGCTSLNVEFDLSNVNSIGQGAFDGCSNISSIVFGDGLETIGNNAFRNCISLSSIKIPQNVVSIGKDAFDGCVGLKMIELYCHSIDAWFANNSSISNVLFGDSVSVIGDKAFENCSGISTVTIPSNITSIGASAFNGCSGLKTLFYNAMNCAIKSQSKSPFSNLISIQNIYIGDEVKSIPNNFTDGLKVSSFSFGKNLTEIGENAFKNANIRKAYISDLANWCNVHFYSLGASPLQYADSLYINGELVDVLTLPNECNTVGDYAFYGFNGYSSLVIPKSISSIGEQAFAESNGLKEIFYNAENCASVKESQPFKNSQIKTVVVGNEVQVIPDYFLNDCNIVDSIVIGNNVSHIGRYAFYGCDSLAKIVLPNSVLEIGEACFMYSGLGEIILSEQLTYIPKMAFKGCHIGSIILPKSIQSLGDESFVMYGYGREETSGPGSGHKGSNSVGVVYVENPNVVSASKAFDYDFDWWNDKYSIPCTAYVPKGSLERYKKVWPWSAFRSLSEWDAPTDVDSSKRDEAISIYNDGVSVYESYVYYYKGEPCFTYDETIGKQNDNDKVATDILYDIDKAIDYVSEASLWDEEKASYLETLKYMYKDVYALKKENESGYYIEFKNHVEKYYDPFSEYNSRLAQYKERIDAAATNDDLDAVISEIETDAANMKDYYLNPIIEDYNAMLVISQRYTEIGEELSKYQLKLNEITKEIDSVISGVGNVVISTNNNVIVVNLRGERLTVKSSQIKTLPKGIYIVNGRKYVVN